MLARTCLLLAIGCITSYGSIANDGSCESERATETSMYVFVGGPLFSSSSGDQSTTLQPTTDRNVNNNIHKPVCMGDPYGSDYRGNVSVTRTGKTCQRWDVNFPHRRLYRPDEYPDELVENYCRNPDRDANFIWCYTTDPNTRWEYCINPACPFVCMGNSTGSDYRGNVSVTRTGETCQRWDVDFPHRRSWRPDEYPELVENYCRNPDGDADFIWCYTTDPSTLWEYCINPECATGHPSDAEATLSTNSSQTFEN